MDHKIEIEVGAIRISYQGSEDYITNELPNLIDKLLSAGNQKGNNSLNGGVRTQNEPSSEELVEDFQLTTNSIGARIGIETGADLAVAACCHLAFVKQIYPFKRSEILQEMKVANDYYKSHHGGNLSRTLKSLVVEKKLIERNKDEFAFDASFKDQLLKILELERAVGSVNRDDTNPTDNKKKVPLSSFIKQVNPNTQQKLFLVTAIWIHDMKNQKRITIKEINKELKNSSQVPLKNSTQELSRNVNKGYCVKDKDTFYVSDDGRESIS